MEDMLVCVLALFFKFYFLLLS